MILNGEIYNISEKTNLNIFLRKKLKKNVKIVVEYNYNIIDKADYEKMRRELST